MGLILCKNWQSTLYLVILSSNDYRINEYIMRYYLVLFLQTVLYKWFLLVAEALLHKNLCTYVCMFSYIVFIIRVHLNAKRPNKILPAGIGAWSGRPSSWLSSQQPSCSQQWIRVLVCDDRSATSSLRVNINLMVIN